MREFFDPFIIAYGEAKAWFTDYTGATEDLLHIHAGLLIFVVSALILKKKMRSPIPLALVVAFALLNEVIDRLAGGPQDSIEPFVDFANTVFWPTVLFLVARRWR
jgi:hypothetical protein